MMRKFLIPLSLFVTAALSGCGFTPLHATTGASGSLTDIDIDMLKGPNVVDNQAGFFVTQRLRDRIGTATDVAPYRLQITPRYRRTRFGLNNADVATRYDITVTAQWVLVDTKTGDRLKRGETRSTTTFGTPSGPFGVITADNVGVEQAATETADKLILDIARYFASEDK